MIGKIINGIMGFIISMVSILLSPIDSFISSNLPGLDSALGHINTFIDYIISIIGYVIDASMLTDVALGMVVLYYTFAIAATLFTSVVKLTIRWYNALKL